MGIRVHCVNQKVRVNDDHLRNDSFRPSSSSSIASAAASALSHLKFSTTFTCSRDTPGNHSRNSSTWRRPPSSQRGRRPARESRETPTRRLVGRRAVRPSGRWSNQSSKTPLLLSPARCWVATPLADGPDYSFSRGSFPGNPAGFSCTRSRKRPFIPMASETLDSPNRSRS